LERAYGGSSPVVASPAPAPTTIAGTTIPGTTIPGPALATSEPPPVKAEEKKDASKPFYTSPWFWGAVGAAAFGGAAVYFATRDNSPSTIHLQLQVR
jgi:hypothetical protein